MKIRRRIARAVALAAILALPVAFHAGSAAALPPAPTKEIKIYNNSLLGPIYPVISTPKQIVDKWLQAFLGVPASGLPTRLYANDDVYRIYINPTTGGIAPGKYVVLKVPLYTQLLPTSKGLIPDEFINWWNGGRVSLYDAPKAIKADYADDLKNPTTPLADTWLVTCMIGCNEPIAIFHSAKGKGDLPSNDPAQLTEYTMGGINEDADPIGFKPKEVDYDVSYVDQVYLPIAMEPVNNPFIGWVGTTQDTGLFKGELQNFLDSTAYPGWPTYLDNAKVPILRIPSTGTIYAAESGANPSPDLSTPGESFNAITKYWKSCTSGGGSGTECSKIKDVEKMFLANYTAYQKAWTDAQCIGILPATPDVEKSMLPHVYGWVPFNETPPDAKCKQGIANALYNTPGYTQYVKDKIVIDKYQEVIEEYKKLQYETPGGVFNPYVQLVHYKPYLDMINAYSFSVDDAVGNMQTVGDGFVIAVGGPAGLPNPAPYDKKKNVQVTVGAPDSSLPQWKEHGFCLYPNGVCQVSTPYDGKNLSFNLETVTYPVEVVLLDTAGAEYKFVIQKGPPYPPSPGTNSVITCLNQFTWCSFINAYTDSKTNPLLPVNAVVTRVPVKPN